VTRAAIRTAAATLLLSHHAFAQSAIPTPRIATPDGTPVTIVADQPDQVIYLARGEVVGSTIPDPFEHVGVAPVQLRLAPGTYTVESGGPTTSTGHAVVRVGEAPLRLEVHTGNASLRTFGAIFIALGVTAVVAGIIVVASYTQKEGSFDKAAIALPLLIGGGVSGLGGLGLTLAGTTNIVVPEGPPVPARQSPAAIASAVLRF
jgi:hypothetical protein